MLAVQSLFSMIMSRVVCIPVVHFGLHRAELPSVVDVEHWSSLRHHRDHDDSRDWLKLKEHWKRVCACHKCSTTRRGAHSQLGQMERAVKKVWWNWKQVSENEAGSEFTE